MVYVKEKNKGGDRFRRGNESVYKCKLCNFGITTLIFFQNL